MRDTDASDFCVRVFYFDLDMGGVFGKWSEWNLV